MLARNLQSQTDVDMCQCVLSKTSYEFSLKNVLRFSRIVSEGSEILRFVYRPHKTFTNWKDNKDRFGTATFLANLCEQLDFSLQEHYNS